VDFQADGAGFADDGHLNLAGVLHTIFDGLGNVFGEAHRAQIVYRTGFDQNADFPVGLEGIGAFNTFK
jgi:hypothetical protein